MASLKQIAADNADELRDGIAWVIIWRTGRSWNAYSLWLDHDDDTFQPDDEEFAKRVLGEDPNAVMLNGYYCGHFGEGMTVTELANGIAWHYANGFNTLDGSTAFHEEPPLPAETSKADTSEKKSELDEFSEKESVLDGSCSFVSVVKPFPWWMIEKAGFVHHVGIKGKTRIVIEYDNDTGRGIMRAVTEDANTIPTPKGLRDMLYRPQDDPTPSNQ